MKGEIKMKNRQLSEEQKKNIIGLHLSFHEIAAEWAYYDKAPLSYVDCVEYVSTFCGLSKELLEWSGAAFEVRIDRAMFEKDPDLLPSGGVDFDAPIWQPFERDFLLKRADLKAGAASFGVQFVSTLWWGSTTARRRHLSKERLDGHVIGLVLYPQTATLDMLVKRPYGSPQDLFSVMSAEV